ncbi:hypothetical protein [Streptomyces sp. NPDC048357]|uniref:hypothetical protein n=1 Tax=Streptomyces sp. NPDC048357 TaxID=3154719 RepID=UPI003421A744
MYEQVERRSWFVQPCPRVRGQVGKDCFNDDGIGSGSGQRRATAPAHDERLNLIIDER